MLTTGLGLAILLHGLYDSPCSRCGGSSPRTEVPEGLLGLVAGLVVLTLSVLIVKGVWAIRLVRREHAQQLPARAARDEPRA